MFLAIAAPVAAIAVRALTFRPLPLAGEAPRDGFTRLRGAIHAHTTFSDGGGRPDEVIAAARAAGLDFVVITDHNNADAKASEGEHDGVLAIVGTEISTDKGHVVALGIATPPYRFSGDARDAFDDARFLHGHAFVAHPTNGRKDLAWTGWDVPGAWGIEVWNGDTSWRSAGALRLAKAAIAYPFGARYALLSTLREPSAVLQQWDRLLATRNVPAIAGADAHQRLGLKNESSKKGRSLAVPSYASMLGLAETHVLLAAGEARTPRAIADALGRGRSYVAVDALADGNGFFFSTDGGATMGDTVAPGATLKAGGALPEGAVVSILKDGQAVGASVANAGPGVYRAEVRVPGWDFPWIVSNPIVVATPEQAAARARAAEVPKDEPPVSTVTIDDFEGATTFAPEFDPSSKMTTPVIVPGQGTNQSAAARIQFELGAPGPGRPYTWCALVSRTPRSLVGRHGLSFNVRSDRPYRMWVQVRDENPASADEGTEWWFASVRTTPEWTWVRIPFDRFRSINPKTDGKLDLDKVKQLVFVLDAGAVAPATKGEILLDEVGAY